jgi:pyruvate/2-oxoglutarate dehydrogenase complex dihydrolipoamide acyltransferase (E2) component
MTTDKSDPIKAEAARYKAATTAAAKSRAALTELVVAALREPGAKPADIANRADWTSAYVRKLAREHGIEANPAYKARTEKARARMLAEAVAAQTSQPAPEPNERPSPKAEPTAEALPKWLQPHPEIAALSGGEATEAEGRLSKDRPEWFARTRRKLPGTMTARWMSYAMLVAAKAEPAEEQPPAVD